MENDSAKTTTKVILFTLDSDTYGVPIDQVQSIERVQSVTRIPNAAPFIEGVMNLRGLVIPVINVRKRFSMQPSEQTKESRIIIVEAESIQVGLLVDAAKEVLDLEIDKIEKTPEIIGGLDADYISGVCGIDEDHLLVLLNLKHVLNDEEIDALKSIKGA